jgi:hypothetical protein
LVAAEKQAKTIIDAARDFIDRLLTQVSKLPGGEKVVTWANGFIKPVTKPKKQSSTMVNENNHPIKRR